MVVAGEASSSQYITTTFSSHIFKQPGFASLLQPENLEVTIRSPAYESFRIFGPENVVSKFPAAPIDHEHVLRLDRKTSGAKILLRLPQFKTLYWP